MIRYVDSAGWTWEVCELADRRAATGPHPVGARPAARRPTDAIAVHPGVADRPRGDAGDALAGFGGAGELYFFSRVGARKLRDYPTTWTQLSRRGLEALCARAQDLDAATVG